MALCVLILCPLEETTCREGMEAKQFIGSRAHVIAPCGTITHILRHRFISKGDNVAIKRKATTPMIGPHGPTMIA